MTDKLNISFFNQGNFYRVPKLLLLGKKYELMSSDAKLLYAIYQDRAELSIKNGWQDSNGDLFFLFTINEIAYFSGWSRKKVIKLKKELIQFELLSELRQGLNRPNKTYLYLIDSKTKMRNYVPKSKIIDTVKALIEENNFTDESNLSRYLQKEFSIECEELEQLLLLHEINLKLLLESFSKETEVSKSDFQKEHKGTSKSPKNSLHEESNCPTNDTDLSKTDMSHTKSDEDDEKNEIKEDVYKDECERIEKELPEVQDFLKYYPKIPSERLKILSLVESLFYTLSYEYDQGNQILIEKQQLTNQSVCWIILREEFLKQLKFTQEHCFSQKRFYEYFAKGLQERIENRIKEYP